MEVLVTGASGLVGSRFVEMYGNSYNLLTPTHQELDITNRQSVTDYFSKNQPEVVINFAAYTATDQSEKQDGGEFRNRNGECWRTNVIGVSNLVETIDPSRTRLIQISTDYVFSADAKDPGPYSENHQACVDMEKMTWYGFTKAEAERIILAKLGDKATILRIIYPVRQAFSGKPDYLKKALEKYQAGKLPPLFTDQNLSITLIDEVCLALAKIIESNQFGIFHAASSDTGTPAEIIPYYLEKTLGEKPQVSLAQMGDWAKRFPQFGGLRVEETEKRLGIKFSFWREIIDKLVEQGINLPTLT